MVTHSPPAPLLETVDLTKSYAGMPVLSHISITLHPGEVVGLLGPNGAGKSTLFNTLIGLTRPERGEIFFDGANITALSIDQRARMGLGYLSQEPSIFRQLSVEENILSILELLPISRQDQYKRLDHLLQELNLSAHAKKRSTHLSGGERRRLEIARTLVHSPKLLLFDEPFANVDPITIEEIKNLIDHLRAKQISIFITDHNARELCTVVDRCYLCQQGSITHTGSIEQLLASTTARRAYFGENFSL